MVGDARSSRPRDEQADELAVVVAERARGAAVRDGVGEGQAALGDVEPRPGSRPNTKSMRAGNSVAAYCWKYRVLQSVAEKASRGTPAQ
jgi:hypothetical protein